MSHQITRILGLSYKNSRKLDQLINEQIPASLPCFQQHEILVANEAFEVWARNILECIKALYNDPEFAPLLLLVPKRHYTNADKTVRMYFDMHTGNWW